MKETERRARGRARGREGEKQGGQRSDMPGQLNGAEHMRSGIHVLAHCLPLLGHLLCGSLPGILQFLSAHMTAAPINERHNSDLPCRTFCQTPRRLRGWIFFCKKSNLRHLCLHAMQHNVYITTHTCPCMLWIHPWIICNQGPHGHWAVTLCECAASSLAEGKFPWRPLGWGWSPKPKRIASACLRVAQVQSLVWQRPPQDIWGSATQNKTKQNKTKQARHPGQQTSLQTPSRRMLHSCDGGRYRPCI